MTIRKPDWLRVKAFSGQRFEEVNRMLQRYGLNTVCQAANCPNRGECFNRGTAAFLILGPRCTRSCRFCDVPSGTPAPPDPEEPRRLAGMARDLRLKHVVVTSVTRDDMADGGAGQFAEIVRWLRRELPHATVELLTPDFKGAPSGPDIIVGACPDVFNHNVETVPGLYPAVRPQADYRHSLKLLQQVTEASDIVTKSGLMVGLGETLAELRGVFKDLAGVGVSILTIGQYLAPSRWHYAVDRYLSPDEFDQLASEARSVGIPEVFAAPLVRSSYRAEDFLPQLPPGYKRNN